jgi:hypothetical protein
VSVEDARSVYSVGLDAECRIDAAETAKLRAAR